MQRRVERTVLDQDLVAGDLLDPARDPVAVQRPATDRLQDQDAERPLEEVDGGPVPYPAVNIPL